MTLLDDASHETIAPAPPPPAKPVEPRPPAFYIRRGVAAIAIVFVLYLLVTEGKARSTLVTVVVAVTASASLWIGANLLFNQVRNRWTRFSVLLYGSVTLAVTAVLSGNRAIGNLAADDGVAKTFNKFVNGIRSGTLTSESFVAEFIAWLWLPLLLSAGAALVGGLLSRTDAPPARLAVGVGGLGGLGIAAGASFNFLARPELDIVGLLAWTALGAGIGAGIGFLRNTDLTRGTLLGAALGWVVGAFGVPAVGGGSAGWTVVAVAVPPALIGLRAALQPNLELRDRGVIDNNSRKWIFLAPAMLFTFAMLVVPALSTLWLSLKDRDGAEYIGVENYREIFRDPNSWDPPDDWKDIFGFGIFGTSTGGSALFIIGLIGLAIFVVVGLRQRAQTGKVVELGSPSMGPLIIGGLFVLLGVVTTFRGTIINNLWWVVIVTLFSTAIGLAIAVLADGIRFEKVAKSIIFMPMAISLVGASVIWRFMYVARDSSKEQTGVLNSLWVSLGRLSTGREVASVALVIVGGLISLSLLNKVARTRSSNIGVVGGAGIVVATAAVAAGLIWLFADTTNTSGRHFAVSVLLIALATIGAVTVLAMALKKDAIGLATGIGFTVVTALVLYGFAGLWGGVLSGTTQKWIVGLAAIVVFVALLAATAQRLTKQQYGGAVVPLIMAALVGWFSLRYFAVWGGGVGGQAINSAGNLKDNPINFVQESPFNSMFLMVVLIWIQTGFAMVILSAAIKAVPTELIEAAKVDGATESQVFWRVTLPQIAPTIGVVVTTIIVLVMKVYDIVNVMTNGNFETQVLANDMFFQAFQTRNQGQGAALAMLIFVSVLPVMVFNIRKMQQEN